MVSLDKFYPEGWLLYCGTCNRYMRQSDPQNFSGRKTVIIDTEPCEECLRAKEEQEAQQIMGRMGFPKENK
jgi:hypothetical protein